MSPTSPLASALSRSICSQEQSLHQQSHPSQSGAEQCCCPASEVTSGSQKIPWEKLTERRGQFTMNVDHFPNGKPFFFSRIYVSLPSGVETWNRKNWGSTWLQPAFHGRWGLSAIQMDLPIFGAWKMILAGSMVWEYLDISDPFTRYPPVS